MKKFFIIILLGFIGYVSNAQSQYIDPRLQQVFNQDYLELLVNEYPQELLFLNWYLDNGYAVKEVGINKCSGLEYLKSFNPFTKTVGSNVAYIDSDMNNFNMFLYNINQLPDRAVTYRIGDTGKVLIILSNNAIRDEFNEYLKQLNK